MNHRRRVFLSLLLTSALAAPVFADGFPRQKGVDAQHYIWQLILHDTDDEFVGQASAELLLTQPDLKEVWLDLMSPANGRGMTVSAVTLARGGQETQKVDFTHEAGVLHVPLPSGTAAGERIVVNIAYKGVPGPGVHIGKNKYGERVLFSENWPDRARQWVPCIDHPSDKATSELIVIAPAKYQVVSNGLLVEEVDHGNGTRLTHWKQSVPIATWLNAIGVAQFAVHHAGTVGAGEGRAVPLQTWVYHQDRETLPAGIEDAARKAMRFYGEYIGPFAYEKLANVQAYGFGGATEHASAIFYGENALRPGGGPGVIAHEIAHQWFGNCVTESDWDDAWLSEGFATYMTLLFTEHYQGRDAFVAGLKRSRATVLATQARLPNQAVIHNKVATGRSILNQLVYQKGSWALHMLRGTLGDAAFQAGLRAYYQKFYNATATTDDFRACMEAASGRDLAWFFTQWLHRPGNPSIEWTWRYDEAAKKVIAEFTQTQPGDPYRLPLELGLYAPGAALPFTATAPATMPIAGAAPLLQKFEMTEKSQRIEFPADRPPASVVLDPNTWLLMDSRLKAVLHE
jgi:aminopeptidase N